MDQSFLKIVEAAREEASQLQRKPDFEAWKARYVGPKGSFTELRKQIGSVPPAERPEYGKKLNALKEELETVIAGALIRVEAVETARKLGPAVDVSLPSPDTKPALSHPLTKVRERIVEIFRRAGFHVADGPELETEYFCFDALNTPIHHPARDSQDTYYFPRGLKVGNVSQHADERYLLRTHTSSVQIRTSLKKEPPLRIISPGRCFRRDTADATHSANFHQVEGLYIDRGVTVKDLKALLDYFARELLGPGANTRFRTHFFPYTEPSFEVDFSAKHLGKVGKDWIEIMGCGMVDPAVFDAVGYDSKEFSGFAFGMGIERIAMTLYGVDDIRHFYTNDGRFLSQF
jgi:phenylalanyl-tRNA synthetase alpha chain